MKTSERYTVTIPGIDLGVYVGYYFGHDYYNIHFDRVINMVQIGISGSVSPSARRRRRLMPSRPRSA